MKNKEEFITEEKAENTPAGGVFVGKKDGQTIIHDEGTMSGYLVGKLHKDGGIKAVNKATGQPLEMQGGEIVITAPAVSDTTKREFEGKMMTNREILSKINSDGGGVSFADGGDIPAKIHTTDKEYEFGGKMVHDTDIAHSLGMNSTLKKGKQQFSSGNLTYDVDAIYNAIKKGKLRLKTKEVETFPMKYLVYDKKYSETVKTDFRKPNGITVRTESGEEVLIDGNHRMNNAYLNGRKTMKTYYIEDPKQIAKFTKKNKFELGGNITIKKDPTELVGSKVKIDYKGGIYGDKNVDKKYLKTLKGANSKRKQFGKITGVKRIGNSNKPNIYDDYLFEVTFDDNQKDDYKIKEIEFYDQNNNSLNPSFSSVKLYADGGHLSKGKSLKQIAEMHNVSLAHINEELAKGLEVEKEHFADFKERARVAKDHLVENPNYYTILEKAGLEKGGKIKKQDLVENAKKGDTPARDLNNYNDLMDLQADGDFGGDNGLAFADGGNINSGIQVGDLFVMDLPDIWRNQDYGKKRQVAIVTNVDNPEKVLIYNGVVYFNIKKTFLLSKKKSSISEVLNEFRNKNDMSVSQRLFSVINEGLIKESIDLETIDLLKERYPNRNIIKTENNSIKITPNFLSTKQTWLSKVLGYYLIHNISNEDSYYVFDSLEDAIDLKYGQPIYANGGITPYDANLEGDSVNIIENGFAKGGVVYDTTKPKVEKVTIKDTRFDRVSVMGRNASNVSELQQIVSDYVGISPKESYDWISFYVNENTRGTYYIDLNKGKKNTVKNVNPETLNSVNFKRVIDAKKYLVSNFDWTDFFELGSNVSKRTSTLKAQPKDAEYYEYIGESKSGFTNGKIYEANYRNLEAEGNFIDDNGDANGFSGSNYKYFKPSTKEAFLAQQGGGSKSNKDNDVFGVTIFYKEDGVEKEIGTINEESLLNYLEVIQLKNNPVGVKLSIQGLVNELDNKFVGFTKQPVLSNDIDPENITISEFRDFLSEELFPEYNFEFFFKQEKTTTSKAVKPFDLKDSKIWIGDNPELSKKIQEFAFANGIYWSDLTQSVTQTDKPCLVFMDYKGETVITFRYDRKDFDKLNLREITEEDIFGNKQTPASIPVVPKTTSQDVYSLDLAIKKLEKVSSLTVSEYSKDIYDKSLDLLYDEKKMYELALKFTPESAFLYERVDILRKLANIEKSIKKIEDMKKGGAFYILSKIIEKLERGEKWQESEQADGVITNKLPQSEIDIIIRSQKFKNWFGDWEKALVNDEYDNVSKALTNGIPSVYHHGARRIKYTYREVSNGVLYLAENISYALWFSQNATAQSEEGNYLTECFVNIKNPIDLTPFHVKQFDLGEIVRFIEAVYPLAKIYDFIPAQIALLIKANEPTNIRMWAWQLIRSYEKFVRHIKENTPYDGFLYYENNPSDMVINEITGELEENVTKAVAIFRSPQVKVVDAVLFDGGLDDWRFENGGKLNN